MSRRPRATPPVLPAVTRPLRRWRLALLLLLLAAARPVPAADLPAGDLQAALAETDTRLAQPGRSAEQVPTLARRAALLDALGQTLKAQAAYAQLDAAGVPTLLLGASEPGLRAVLVDVQRGRPEALAAWAQRRSGPTRWRAALALGAVGRPDLALDLAEGAAPAPAAAPNGAADALRLAGWALEAGRPQAARRHARDAALRARHPHDRRDALALLVEACRSDGRLDEAVAELARLPASPERDALRLDVLLIVGRTDDALALLRASPDPALRGRLVEVLQASGRPDAVAAELRRLVERQPAAATPSEALAALLLGQGDDAGARAVFARLFQQPRPTQESLQAALRSLARLGLVDDAEALLAAAPAPPALRDALWPTLQTLRFDHALDQGRDDQARALLDAWHARLPAASPERLHLAEGYERMGLPALALAQLQQLADAGGALDEEQQVHRAQLLAVTGDDAQALREWRRLWAATALPARRDQYERQIVATAKRLGRLPELIADELRAHRADPGHPGRMRLLLSLYIERQDDNGARALVAAPQPAAGHAPDREAERQRLTLLAQVYTRMREPMRAEEALRALARLDPDNAADPLRRVVQSMLRRPQTRPARDGRSALPAPLQEVVRELQAATGLGEAENIRYLGTLYAAADLPQHAVAALRHAVELAPGDLGARLQLATALARAGQLAVAVGQLQQAALQADDDRARVELLGGLVDLLTPSDDTEASEAERVRLADPTLAWAQRQVLARLVVGGDAPRLLALLADLAQARGDAGLQRRAIEAVLPSAGDQRVAVLRQLFAMTAASAPGEGGARGADPVRRAAYARRLVLLQPGLPPSVQAELARALLAQGDTGMAERALARLDDAGGMVNTARLRADAYADAGLVERALADYRRALQRTGDDVEARARAGLLLEGRGRFDEAWAQHWAGLLALLRHQPLQRAADAEAPTQERERWLALLTEGVLLNWPAAPAATAAALRDWQALCDATPSPASDGALRRTLIEQVQQRLLAGPAAGWRAALGQPAALPATAEMAAEPGAALRAQVAAEGPLLLQVQLAVAAGDADELAALVQQGLKEEAAVRRPAAPAAQAPTSGLWALALRASVGQLPGPRLEQLFLAPLQEKPWGSDVLLDLLRADTPTYDALQRAVGRPLLPTAALLDGLLRRGDRRLPSASIRREASGTTLLARFDTAQLLGLLDTLATLPAGESAASGLLPQVWLDLLRRPLDAAEQAALRDRLRRLLGQPPSGADPAAVAVLRLLLVLDAPPPQQGLLLQVASDAAALYPELQALPAFLGDWYRGDKPAAYAALQALGEAEPVRETMAAEIQGLVRRHLDAARHADLAGFLAEPAPTPQATETAIRRHLLAADGTPGGAERLALIRRLAALRPDEPAYRAGVVSELLDRDDLPAAMAELQAVRARWPDDGSAALAQGLLLRLLGQPEAAAAVAQATWVDLDDVDALVRAHNLVAAQPGRPALGGLHAVLVRVYQRYRLSPQAPSAVVAAVAERLGAARDDGAAGAPAAAGLPWPRWVLASAAEDDSPEAAARMLRLRWRASLLLDDERAAAGGTAPDTSVARTQLVDALVGGSDAAGLPTWNLASAPLADELALLLRALTPATRARQQGLYELLARSLQRQGRTSGHLQALLQAQADGTLDDHGLLLLAHLALGPGAGAACSADGAAALPPAALAGLAAQLQRLRLPAAGWLLGARLWGASGRHDHAGAALQAALWRLLWPTPQDALDSGGRALGLADVQAALACWPRPEVARIAPLLAAQVATVQALEPTVLRSLGPWPGTLVAVPESGSR